MLNSPGIAELTVEDPVEAFEDLRDRNDLKMLLGNADFMHEALGEGWEADLLPPPKAPSTPPKSKGHRYHPYANGRSDNGHTPMDRLAESYANGYFNGGGPPTPPPEAQLLAVQEGLNAVANGNGNGNAVVRSGPRGKLGPPADRAWLERRRVELKMASRQFYRLVEMLMLRFIIVEGCDKRLEKAYRIWVKERLFRFNYVSARTPSPLLCGLLTGRRVCRRSWRRWTRRSGSRSWMRRSGRSGRTTSGYSRWFTEPRHGPASTVCGATTREGGLDLWARTRIATTAAGILVVYWYRLSLCLPVILVMTLSISFCVLVQVFFLSYD